MNNVNNTWDNINNYKPCQKKQYEIWVCQPPKGTVVINKLEQADTVRACNGREYFTAQELKSGKFADKKEFIQSLVKAGKAYYVKENTFVLCGTLGELWCISGEKLGQKYVFAANDEPITPRSVKAKQKNDCMDWVKVRTRPDKSKAFACFVPAREVGQIKTSWAILNINGKGVPHGKGDFVISQPDANGKPSSDRYVVNGLVFGATYDNRGWTDKLQETKANEGVSEEKLPKLCVGTHSSGWKTDIMQVIYNLKGSVEEEINTAMMMALQNRDYYGYDEKDVKYEDLLPLPKLYEKVKSYKQENIKRVRSTYKTDSKVEVEKDILDYMFSYAFKQLNVEDRFAFIMHCSSGFLKEKVKELGGVFESNPNCMKELLGDGGERGEYLVWFTLQLRLLSFLADCLSGKRGEEAFCNAYMCSMYSVSNSLTFAGNNKIGLLWGKNCGRDSSDVVKIGGGALHAVAPMLRLIYIPGENKYLFSGAFADPHKSYTKENIQAKNIFSTKKEDMLALDSKMCKVLKESTLEIVNEYKYDFIQNLKEMMYYQQFVVTDLVRSQELDKFGRKKVQGIVLTKGTEGAKNLVDTENKRLAEDSTFRLALNVKVDGTRLVVTAKHQGKVLNVGDIRVSFFEGKQTFDDTYRVYLSVCNILKVSPFQFILSGRFLNNVIAKVNELAAKNGGKRMYMSIKKGSVENIEKKTHMSDEATLDRLSKAKDKRELCQDLSMSRKLVLRCSKDKKKVCGEVGILVLVKHNNYNVENNHTEYEKAMLSSIVYEVCIEREGVGRSVVFEYTSFNAAQIAWRMATGISKGITNYINKVNGTEE